MAADLVAIDDGALSIGRWVVHQDMVRTLGQIAALVPQINDTPRAALVLAVTDDLARNVNTIRDAVKHRLVELAPIDVYQYRGERKTRPAKSQVVEQVGEVVIATDMNRKWTDKPALALDMIGELVANYAQTHDGEHPHWRQIVEWVTELFPLDDPRIKAMAAHGLGAKYDTEDYRSVNPHNSVSVR